MVREHTAPEGGNSVHMPPYLYMHKKTLFFVSHSRNSFNYTKSPCIIIKLDIVFLDLLALLTEERIDQIHGIA